MNLDKTKVVIFRKGRLICSGEFVFNGNETEVVNSYKYLGCTLTTKLSSNSACEENASKAKGKIVDLTKTM